jgi:hypothetical protein
MISGTYLHFAGAIHPAFMPTLGLGLFIAVVSRARQFGAALGLLPCAESRFALPTPALQLGLYHLKRIVAYRREY